MEPLISVIVPIYNVEKYLDKCVQSIVNQTYKNLEIILVDDGSPDNCCQLCDDWAKRDSRIKVIHKENGGVSSARNVALDAANGDYVGFVDGDDYIEPVMYEKLLSCAMANNADIVVCNNSNETEDAEQLSLAFYKENVFCEENVVLEFIRSIEFDSTSTCNKLFRKEITSRFDKEIIIGEDYLFNYYSVKQCSKLYVISDVLYHYVFHNKSAMRSANVNIIERYKNVKKILDSEKDNIRNYNACLIKYQSELLCCLRELLRSKNKDLIKECFNEICCEIKAYSKDFLKLNISKINRMSIKMINFCPSFFKILYSIYMR